MVKSIWKSIPKWIWFKAKFRFPLILGWKLEKMPKGLSWLRNPFSVFSSLKLFFQENNSSWEWKQLLISCDSYSWCCSCNYFTINIDADGIDADGIDDAKNWWCKAMKSKVRSLATDQMFLLLILHHSIWSCCFHIVFKVALIKY